ncbi:MAG TPA: 30S ribosomal protein S16 [Candidatus Doudnabacteria bacterium]|nr:30S ribosomal protein S16 [Candidatus Doudnabacteria bacterium]
MLTIRLQRGGKRNTAQYKVVLAQKTAANQKKFTEILGAYNPHTKELTIRSDERLNYWMNEQHVPLSETVHNLFVTKEILKAGKVKSFTIPKKEVVAEEAAPEAKAEDAGEAPEAEVATDETLAEPAVETPAEAQAEQATPEEVTTEASAEVEAPAPSEVKAPTEAVTEDKA